MRVKADGIKTALVAGALIMLMALAQTASAVSATGGNSTNLVGGYLVHTFTNDGTFTVSGGGFVEVLVVAGGGSGGGSTYHGGGGGAGGLIYSNAYPVSAGSISVTVGAGGTVPGDDRPGNNGSNSIFGTLTAKGGGGGSVSYSSYGSHGKDGGSGGGGGRNFPNPGNAVPSDQGHAGGSGSGETANFGSGGGGGAGSVGTNGTGSVGGNGGAGLEFAQFSAVAGSPAGWFAGGGGGGIYNSTTGGSGGAGGGGQGGGGFRPLSHQGRTIRVVAVAGRYLMPPMRPAPVVPEL